MLNSRQTELESEQKKDLNELKLKEKSWADQKPTPQQIQFKQRKLRGLSQSKAAEALGLGIATIKRHWNKVH